MQTICATRSQHLGLLITQAVLAHRLQWGEYAAAVVDHYLGSVPATERGVRFHVATCADDHERASRNNTQTVRRLLTGEIAMSTDIEESLIAALPEAARPDVMAALLARSGLMYARLPAAPGDVAGQVGGPCELMRATADAVQAILPMLADRRGIGPEDAPYFRAALRELGELQGEVATLVAQIAQAMPESERRAVLRSVGGGR
jgi:hypothetical protein